MKRINILIVFIVAALFAACSESFEDKAKDRCVQHFMDIFKDRYASTNIKNQKIMFSGDSICIIQYTALVESHSGTKEEQLMEYTLAWSREAVPQLREFTYPIGGKTRALQDDLIRTSDILGTTASKDNPKYERMLRTEVILKHILDPKPFKRLVKE